MVVTQLRQEVDEIDAGRRVEGERTDRLPRESAAARAGAAARVGVIHDRIHHGYDDHPDSTLKRARLSASPRNTPPLKRTWLGKP